MYGNSIFIHLRPLARSYHEVVHSVFRAESHDGKGAVQKKRHMEYEERINGLYTNTRLFHKGIDLFTGPATEVAQLALPFLILCIEL